MDVLLGGPPAQKLLNRSIGPILGLSQPIIAEKNCALNSKWEPSPPANIFCIRFNLSNSKQLK